MMNNEGRILSNTIILAHDRERVILAYPQQAVEELNLCINKPGNVSNYFGVKVRVISNASNYWALSWSIVRRSLPTSKVIFGSEQLIRIQRSG